MITVTEQLRSIADRLEEIEMESSIDKPIKPSRDSDSIEGLSVKPKYGRLMPSHEPDSHAMDFLIMMDKWKEKIEMFDSVQDERLKNDLKYWLEVLTNKIQQL